MDVSIIIVNYKTVPLILNCIESIYKQTTGGLLFEIIIVDNNSEDDFEKKIKDRFPEVICVPLSSNIGFGRANNEGIKIAKGRNTLFLNPDTILINNAIKILSDYLDMNNSVGACGGNLYDEGMHPTHSYRMLLPSLLWEMNNLFYGYIEKLYWKNNYQFNHSSQPIEVGYICGADLMIPTRILNNISGFSSDFFMYFKETELEFRIKKAGFKIISVPQAKIMHLEGKSFDPKYFNERKVQYFENSSKIYYRLTQKSRFIRILINSIHFLSIVIHMILALCRFKIYKANNARKRLKSAAKIHVSNAYFIY